MSALRGQLSLLIVVVIDERCAARVTRSDALIVAFVSSPSPSRREKKEEYFARRRDSVPRSSHEGRAKQFLFSSVSAQPCEMTTSSNGNGAERAETRRAQPGPFDDNVRRRDGARGVDVPIRARSHLYG